MIANIPEYNGIGIYCITNTHNGKKYVGSSVHIRTRAKAHAIAIKTLNCSNAIAKDAQAGHSFCFEILEMIADGCTAQYLQTREQYYITALDTLHTGYNSPNQSPFSGQHSDRKILSSNHIRGQAKLDHITIRVQGGEKDRIKAHAQSKGMSLNAYIVGLIEKDMGTNDDIE